MFRSCFLFKATFQMADLTHLCTMVPEIAAQIVVLNNDGRSVRYIAQHLYIPRSTVQDALSRFRETHGFWIHEKAGSDHSRSITDRDDRFLCLSVLRDRGLPSTILAGRLTDVRGVMISAPTVRRRLKERGLSAKTPTTGRRLTVGHRRARLEYVNRGDNEWKNVLFTDESRFNPRSPDGCEKVWRRPGERYSQCCISPRSGYNGGSIMIWADISLEAHTDLVFVENGAMAVHRYILECVESHVVPYASFIGENFLFMDDNARPHMARIVVRYLEQVGIRLLPWPANSPDLNPIEHVWDFLGKRVRRRQLRPETLNGLRVALEEECAQIPQDYIATLIQSMPNRLRDAIRARCGNTRY
jgi:transposase